MSTNLVIVYKSTQIRIFRQAFIAPKPYLDERDRAKIDDVARELRWRLEETLGENSGALVLLRSRRLGDNSGDGPASADDRQGDLYADPLILF